MGKKKHMPLKDGAKKALGGGILKDGYDSSIQDNDILEKGAKAMMGSGKKGKKGSGFDFQF